MILPAASTAGPLPEAVGSLAAFRTTIFFLPQLIRVRRRKSAADISLAMFLLFNPGLVCRLIYGIGIHSVPIAAANTVTPALAMAIPGLKLRCDRKGKSRERGNKGPRDSGTESCRLQPLRDLHSSQTNRGVGGESAKKAGISGGCRENRRDGSRTSAASDPARGEFPI